MTNKVGECPCCKRDTRLTFHHLIPRKMHRRNFFKKHFTKSELQTGIYICRQCHSGIHRFYDEMTLAKHFYTLPLLLEDEQLATFFRWVAKQRVRV
ncbi:hypothetical protein C6Y39_17650 [Alteromonas gracilis]|uniref:HNH domain-containing protein n=1 Tax=Alteromonas gracilis TaxID=1479524 RepID=A0ABX5CJF5_9ALTE|nr:hypothetical protein C6Y39_17650 [Alteromonas gracilis]